MQESWPFLFNDSKHGILFCEHNQSMSFDEMVQSSYEMHPANFDFEQSFANLHLDPCLESKQEQYGLYWESKITTQFSFSASKLAFVEEDHQSQKEDSDTKCKDMQLLEEWREGWIMSIKHKEKASPDYLKSQIQPVNQFKGAEQNSSSSEKLQTGLNSIQGMLILTFAIFLFYD